MNSVHPGLVLIITGLLCLCLPEKIRKWMAVLGALCALGSMIMLNQAASLTYRFSSNITMELLKVDRLSWLFGLAFCGIAFIAGIYAMSGGSKSEKSAQLIYAGSSIGVVFAGDWISLIFFWETMALASTYIVWSGNTHQARRASYRYLLMHLFGGNLLIGGAIALCSSGNFEIEMLTGGGGYGYWFVLIGVLINAAVPPLHTWVADAYPEATPSGTLYMGSYTTKVAIYALIRLFAGTEELILVGAIMAVFGACMALIENDLRRLLAYHIVSQLGMMVAALATGSATGIDGASLHAVFNILYKGVLLMAVGAVFVSTGKKKISELGGIWKKMPLVSICFLIASLAIAGMPFLNGFASKALIMASLSEGNYTVAYWLVNIAGVGTWLSITLKINYFVFFGKGKKEIECSPVPIEMKVAMIIGTLLCILTGIFPGAAYQLTANGTMAHPFSPEHILEYLGMFIGATVPFVLFIKKMKPHDAITLDFDWVYRRPICRVVFGFSRFTVRVFNRFRMIADNFLFLITVMLNTPGQLSYRLSQRQKKDAEEPIGQFMEIFILFCLIAFITVLLLE